MQWDVLIPSLVRLGCDVVSNPVDWPASPGGTLATVSADFAQIARIHFQIQKIESEWYELREVRKSLQLGIGKLAFDPQDVLRTLRYWHCPHWIYDRYLEMADVQLPGEQVPLLNAAQYGLIDFALKSFEFWNGFRRRLLHQKVRLSAAKYKYSNSFAILNSTGKIKRLAVYSSRSCFAENGMWNYPQGANTTAKVLAALFAMGFRSGATVLDVGAGCGEYLPGVIAAGAKVVAQDLMLENLAFLRQGLKIATCGSEAVHALSQMPARAFEFVISNGLTSEYSGSSRCGLLQEALRVAKAAVFFGWNQFSFEEWRVCGTTQSTPIYYADEVALFGQHVEYQYFQGETFRTHALIAFVRGNSRLADTSNAFSVLRRIDF